jgi:hypothetical protein
MGLRDEGKKRSILVRTELDNNVGLMGIKVVFVKQHQTPLHYSSHFSK